MTAMWKAALVGAALALLSCSDGSGTASGGVGAGGDRAAGDPAADGGAVGNGAENPSAGSTQPAHIETGSDAAFQQSLDAVQAPLTEDEKNRFGAGFVAITRQALGGDVKEAKNTPEARARLAAALQGKTAAEVIAEGDKAVPVNADGGAPSATD